MTLAEFFRDEGRDVLLFIDNIFRFTQAGSEVSALRIDSGKNAALHNAAFQADDGIEVREGGRWAARVQQPHFRARYGRG